MTLILKASDDLLIAAGELNENGHFNTTQDVIDFFEKPWKWETTLKEMGIEVSTE